MISDFNIDSIIVHLSIQAKPMLLACSVTYVPGLDHGSSQLLAVIGQRFRRMNGVEVNPIKEMRRYY